MHRYKIEIFYSEEDEGYIAVARGLPGCSAFGKTKEEALKEIKVAIELWLEIAQKEGRRGAKYKLTQGLEKEEEFIYNREEAIEDLGEVQSEVVLCPK